MGRERKKSGGDRGTMAPKGESLSQEHLEARVNGALLKEALKEVGKAFFAFDSCVEQKQGGEGDEDETSASFTRANNALDNLAMKLTKVNLAIKALNADRDQYEESRKRSGEESAEIMLRIEEKKLELEEAKGVKAFYLECEKLKEEIVQIPSCSKLQKNIEETLEETEAIKDKVQHMDSVNQHRQDLLDNVFGSLSALERTIENEEKLKGIRVKPELIEAIQRETFSELTRGTEDEEMEDVFFTPSKV